MNNSVVAIIGFALGAAAGSFITLKVVKDKYRKLADEEIASVKERFTYPREKTEKTDEITPTEIVKKATNKPDIMVYNKEITKHKYFNYSNVDGEDEEEEETKSNGKKEVKKPFVISPDDFGDIEEYDRVSYTLYADGILADENEEVIENVEESVGPDALERIGQYEDDAVHVQNDKMQMYIEILVDERKYLEANPSKKKEE